MTLNGQAFKRKFLVIRDNPLVSNPSFANPENQDCCFQITALAETTKTDDLKNDKHSWIQFYSEAFNSANLTLQKWNGSDFVDLADLIDDTYGKFYEFGFYETIYNEKAIGYLIDWQKILIEEGEGDYRLKSSAATFTADDVVNYSFEFCLKQYTPNRADGTVRFEWVKNGNSGSLTEDTKKVDYGKLNWYNQIRLQAFFGLDSSEFEQNYVKYQNGLQNWLEDNQIEEYTLKIGRIPNYLHKFVKIDLLQSGEIYVTDYNLNNPTPHVKKRVVQPSAYSPRWDSVTMLAPVDINLRPAFQNLTVKRS